MQLSRMFRGAVPPNALALRTEFEAVVGVVPGYPLPYGALRDPSQSVKAPNSISARVSPRHTRGMRPFHDRVDAGRQLAQRLDSFRGQDVVVLGLPRGGVPVAFEVAKALRAPLDVLVVRKLGVPFQPELAFGAIGEGEVRVINDSVVREARLSGRDMDEVESEQRVELDRRSERFRRGHDRTSLKGRTALIVDDGIATGATAKAACQVARAQGASRVVLAVPIGPNDIYARFAKYADEVVCLRTPAFFFAVGQGYGNFTQTSDDEVIALLDRARNGFPEISASPIADPPLRDQEVEVAAGPVTLAGHLTIPEHPTGIVVFAHGSGSSRHSPRNRYVAEVLNRAGLATLLFDLLTAAEERNRTNVFDIELLAGRLVDVTGWLAGQPDTASLPVGYFGASTGAGAALVAATDPRVKVGAVVSRGGRPDLAGRSLANVVAPTLLIVGGRDEVVLELNQRARAAIPGECELAVVPGATHLFEEPGTLEQVAVLAGDWFIDHLTRVGTNP
jgi:putative phosphoribosyl transferase